MIKFSRVVFYSALSNKVDKDKIYGVFIYNFHYANSYKLSKY